MKHARSLVIAICGIVCLGAMGCSHASHGLIMISGNENKVDLTTGTQKVLTGVQPDNLSILDFGTFPPKVTTVRDVTNSVIGPPSNIAISPDATLALVANSIKADASVAAGWSPDNYIHILDLKASPPKVVGKVVTDLQPSGLSFTPDGKFAIVANRGAGTVSVLSVDGTTVKLVQTLKVSEPAESVSDVAISPDGKKALATVQKSGYLVELLIGSDGRVAATGRKISTYGQPYRVVITPEGDLAVTAGSGFGNGLDMDALTVIDLKSPGAPRTVDFVPLGTVPESLEISPDGKLIAVSIMDGSNTATTNPIHSDPGAAVILQRKGKTFVKTQRVPVGRIPEGIAFTSDGKYIVVQCHPDRKLWILRVAPGGKVEDTGQRIDVPGMPSSLRSAMNH